LQNIFPGRNQGEKVRINISKIYDVHYQQGLNRVYKSTAIPDADEKEAVNDPIGYIGVFHRKDAIDDRLLQSFTMEQLAQVFSKIATDKERNEKLATIMRTIK
jgi:hypothetical protein